MKFLIVLTASLVAICQSSTIISSKQESERDWYETAIIYHIYPRSFKDSNDDGIGDINGIISELNHLKDMGVGAVWLGPIYKSAMKDFGYDVTNFTEIEEAYGTMEDLLTLFDKANEADIKIILDFVPNHTSDECEWFKLSVANNAQYKDYYVWEDGTNEDDIPPNNWNSVFNGSAWTWNEERQQFYLHQFDKSQPDLNYRNPTVVEEMKIVLEFWLEKGASGFRVGAANYLFEAKNLLQDEPIDNAENTQSYGYTHKLYTRDLDESYDMIYQWRTVLDDHQTKNGGETRIMITEAYANETLTMKFYQNSTHQGSHIPFNFVLINDLTAASKADDFKKVIDDRIDALPDGKVMNWVTGNHDHPRVASRYGTEKVDALLTLVMTLPGIAVTYNGEEIGMVDFRTIPFERTLDLLVRNKYPGPEEPEEGWQWLSRDPERTPFQWNDSDSAGFCNCENTWLPVNDNYPQLNLARQKSWRKSTFNYYKDLSRLRRDQTMMEGSYESFVEKEVFLYTRTLAGHNSRLVLINFGDTEQVVNVSKFTNIFGEKLKVLIAGAESAYDEDDILDTNDVYLRKFNTIVVENYEYSGADNITLSLGVIIYAILLFLYV